MDTEDRWYVRFRGHTLGPLTSEQVKSSVRRKELGPDDKLASASNPNWRALRTESDFLRYWEALTRPVPAELTPLPSPKILWQKKRAALPVAPEKSAPAAPATAATAKSESPIVSSVAAPAPPPDSERRIAKSKGKAKAKAKPAKKSKPAPARRAVRAKEIAPAETKIVAEPAAEAKVSLEAIPAKPEMLPAAPAASEVVTVSNLTASAPAASPKLAEETLSLLEALRDWNRKEKESLSAQTNIEAAPAIAPIASPALSTETFSPAAFSRPAFTPSESFAEPAKKAKTGIELRLNLVVSKQFILISALVAAAALAAILFTLSEAKKMRGPVGSRLPDPSSPTIEPSSENDPIPQLKAPTRPRRD